MVATGLGAVGGIAFFYQHRRQEALEEAEANAAADAMSERAVATEAAEEAGEAAATAAEAARLAASEEAEAARAVATREAAAATRAGSADEAAIQLAAMEAGELARFRAEKLEQSLEAVRRALAAFQNPNPSDEQVARLHVALQCAEESDAMNADTDILLIARRRLQDLERMRLARVSGDVAQDILKLAIVAQDAVGCRAALAEIDAAERTLSELGDEFPTEQGLVAEGRVHLELLDELEAIEAAKSSREVAVEVLNAALVSRDPAHCSVALAEAQAAGVQPCSRMELVSVLTEPDRFLAALVSEGAERLVESRGGLVHGLEVGDFAAAASAAAASLSKDQLHRQAMDLARAIVTLRILNARELGSEMRKAGEEILQRSKMRTATTSDHLTSEKLRLKERQMAALREARQRGTDLAMAEVTSQVRMEAEASNHEMREAVALATAKEVTKRSQAFFERFLTLLGPPAAVDVLVEEKCNLPDRAHMSGTLFGTLIALRDALWEGQATHAKLRGLQKVGDRADCFVAHVLASLLADRVESDDDPLPTPPQLRRRFGMELRSVVAAAFVLPSEGPLSEALSHLTAWTFGHLYALRPERSGPPAIPVARPYDGSVRQNLEALERAARLVEQGDLAEALSTMEARLSGECRVRAAGWMAATRQALLLQQAVRAVQAEACCLSAVLA